MPETKKLDELLPEFQGDKVHMAVVLDEYGGTAGLVTIEDVVEEIVGEIVDEYEQAPPQPIRRLEGRAFEVEARVRISELNDELGLTLPESEDYETIGGLVLSRLGYIPKAGEALQEPGLKITVLEAEPQHQAPADRSPRGLPRLPRNRFNRRAAVFVFKVFRAVVATIGSRSLPGCSG